MRILFFKILTLTLLLLLSTTNAIACSVAPREVPWAPGYKIYSHLEQDDPFSKYDSISIVSPVFEEVSEQDFEAFRHTTKGQKKFTHVKFKVLKKLKGKNKKDFYLRGGGSGFETIRSSQNSKKLKKSIIRKPHYLENLNPDDTKDYYWASLAEMYRKAKEIAHFRAESGYHETTQFFDLFDVTIPRIGEPTTAVTCGSHIEYTVFPEMTYIAFRQGDRVVYLEPISGIDDPFVKTIESLVLKVKPIKMKTTLPEFLKNKRLVIFEIINCPTRNEYLDKQAIKIPSIKNTRRYNNVRRRNNHEYYAFPYSRLEVLYDSKTWRPSHYPISFTLANLDQYLKSTGLKELKCSPNDMYLAIGPRDSWSEYYDVVYPAFRSQSKKFDWRFLRVKNQRIVVQDLMSNLEITDNGAIKISDIIR